MSTPAIVHLVFPTPYLMSASLLRFQESYESPKFRGNTRFSLEEFMDWYATSKSGRFSYFDDWSGFNFPGHILQGFGKDENLGAKEKVVRSVVYGAANRLGLDPSSVYVLGTTEKARMDLLSHEVVHALFYLYPDYADQVKRLCRKHAHTLKPMHHWLKTVSGYHKTVWDDETNSYLVTGLPGDSSVEVISNLRPLFKTLLTDHFSMKLSDLKDEKWLKKHVHRIPMKAQLRKIRY